jgi:hypothetical protein
LSKRLHLLVTEQHGKCTHHGDPRLIADECGARERPEKNAACSHFLHDITARSLSDAVVCHGHRGNLRWSIGMTKTLLIMAAIAGIFLLPSAANAQERLGDGAMGALAGALVGGPAGLVAGGVVGYSAGPSIASSWGLRGHWHYRHVHYRRYPAQ